MTRPSALNNTHLKEIKTVDMGLSLVILDLRDAETMQAYMVLFEKCFGKRHNIDAQLFDWLNNAPPNYKNLNFALIDRSNNRLICAYGLLPGEANLNCEKLKFALCTNVMTHPDYSGKGLFALIGKEALSYANGIGINFCFGVPNEQAIKGHLKVGWKVINELSFYQQDYSFNREISCNEEIITDVLNKLSDSDFQSFYNSEYNFFFTRTIAWLKWRMSKPHSSYISFGFNTMNKKGFMVLKQFIDQVTGKKKLHIVDFGYNSIETFRKLIDHCTWLLQTNKYDLLNLWHYTFNEKETEVLVQKGFVPSAVKNPIIINDLGNKILVPKGNWHVTLFDNDVY